jgi:hypothetical protein
MDINVVDEKLLNKRFKRFIKEFDLKNILYVNEESDGMIKVTFKNNAITYMKGALVEMWGCKKYRSIEKNKLF